ncbi:aldehyde dehydrogenase family protein [Pseudoruegeria sp. HB172150]|uniref:aldehyde dehydrogenase family protein n=1 Tax=Pseudoruegeria sp. HB172150 TaxID=2721164 RepID=UPI0020A68776|nr:aldehyde dehydrogenase family protein [Pseudoruegeria sp. HB172150]
MNEQSRNMTTVPNLPENRGLYYGGAWHEPAGGYTSVTSPATGADLGQVAEANQSDVAAAAEAAHQAFQSWRWLKPSVRGDALRQVAEILRQNREELALIDAIDCGNPVKALMRDVDIAAELTEYFAGLVYETRGATIPMGDGIVNMTIREPYGVCARIVAYNHPIMFIASRFAAPVAAGNTVIMKPPPQAPLSALRFAELIDGVFPPGVFNVLTGGKECGEALVAHPLIPKITLIGSIPTGRAISRGASDRLKDVSLELGGKNALVVYPDADLDRAAAGAVKGMAFTWCGQACSSTTRLFLHEDIHDAVLDRVAESVKAFRPGIPTDPETTMGAIVSKEQYDKILSYIEIGKSEGARLVAGGKRPDDPQLADGWYIEPTVFAEVTADMRIAQEEIFGPVLSVLKWRDEDEMFAQVNAVEYGLAGGVFTRDLATAHRAISRIEAGYTWVNNAAAHFFPAPFGGTKQSGNNREECFEELLSFTQVKNVYIDL